MSYSIHPPPQSRRLSVTHPPRAVPSSRCGRSPCLLRPTCLGGYPSSLYLCASTRITPPSPQLWPAWTPHSASPHTGRRIPLGSTLTLEAAPGERKICPRTGTRPMRKDHHHRTLSRHSREFARPLGALPHCQTTPTSRVLSWTCLSSGSTTTRTSSALRGSRRGSAGASSLRSSAICSARSVVRSCGRHWQGWVASNWASKCPSEQAIPARTSGGRSSERPARQPG